LSLLPLSLGVRRKPEAGGAVFRNRSKLKSLTEKALWRDDNTCRCCGFQSRKYQRVISPGDEQNTDDSLITVCPFCEQCFMLDRAGMTGSGVLIWLPEITQAELHHLMRAIYMVRDTEHPLAATARRIQDSLMARRTEAKKRLGSDDPLLLATVLRESLTDKEYAAREPKLKGVRLLPLDRLIMRDRTGDRNYFDRVINYWRSPEGPFGSFSPDKWKSLFDSVVDKIGTRH